MPTIKLRDLERANQMRRAHALQYERLLHEIEEIITPQVQPYAMHVFHIYAVRVQRRHEIMRLLEENGIGCAVHYPVPVHR